MIRPCCERCGSSPLTRGKRCRYPGGRGHGGLIPAHAGKTIFQALLTRTTGAHPRSRGENAHPQATAVGEGGSSPLTRGKPLPSTRQLWSPGLIPAHAGKTRPGASTATSYAAHPRSRGENVFFEALCQIQCGSSPLTRGKPSGDLADLARQRLIPAHAGKTMWAATQRRAFSAHPRSRGENSTPLAASCAVMGSSPLTRGKLADQLNLIPTNRLIPAHAGKTRQR